MRIIKGERFVTTEDIPTKALTHWKAPYTDGVACTIPKGTTLIAASDSMPLQSGFACTPVDLGEVEKAIIPETTRADPKYAGYSFVLKVADVGKRLKRVG